LLQQHRLVFEIARHAFVSPGYVFPAQNSRAAIRPRAASGSGAGVGVGAGAGSDCPGAGATAAGLAVGPAFRATTSKSLSLKSFRTTWIASNESSPCTGPRAGRTGVARFGFFGCRRDLSLPIQPASLRFHSLFATVAGSGLACGSVSAAATATGSTFGVTTGPGASTAGVGAAVLTGAGGASGLKVFLA
jgi:hypothetical protein